MKIGSFFLILLSLSLASCGEGEESTEELCEITSRSPIFAILEHAEQETIVGQVEVEAGDRSEVTFSIVSGNQDNVFAIDPVTGTITVNNSSDLDFEKIRQFVLNVRASSPTCRPAMIMVTINVVDIQDTING